LGRRPLCRLRRWVRSRSGCRAGRDGGSWCFYWKWRLRCLRCAGGGCADADRVGANALVARASIRVVGCTYAAVASVVQLCRAHQVEDAAKAAAVRRGNHPAGPAFNKGSTTGAIARDFVRHTRGDRARHRRGLAREIGDGVAERVGDLSVLPTKTPLWTTLRWVSNRCVRVTDH